MPPRIAKLGYRSEWRTYRMPWTRGLGNWYCILGQDRYVVVRLTRFGLAIASRSGRFRSSDGRSQIEELQLVTESMMKRRPKQTGKVVCPPHANYDVLLEHWPSLAAWFTDGTFDDGAARPAGWLSLTARQDAWHVMLKDSGEEIMINLAAPTLPELIELVEHALSDPLAQWRPDPGHKAPRPKRGR